MSDARDAVLERVRLALAGVPEEETPDDVTVRRDYLHREQDATLDRFVERVSDYGARVHVTSADAVAAAVAEAFRPHGVRRFVVPDGMPPDWLPDGAEAVADTELSAEELDAVGAVLTGCALAIAETGTLVFDGGPRQGRRALTLVPDLHVCVVEAEQVVGGVPSAMRRLAPAVRTERRPLTLVSGPSATSDIELSRVEGVHGPRRLEVVVVQAEAR